MLFKCFNFCAEFSCNYIEIRLYMVGKYLRFWSFFFCRYLKLTHIIKFKLDEIWFANWCLAVSLRILEFVTFRVIIYQIMLIDTTFWGFPSTSLRKLRFWWWSKNSSSLDPGCFKICFLSHRVGIWT